MKRKRKRKGTKERDRDIEKKEKERYEMRRDYRPRGVQQRSFSPIAWETLRDSAANVTARNGHFFSFHADDMRVVVTNIFLAKTAWPNLTKWPILAFPTSVPSLPGSKLIQS